MGTVSVMDKVINWIKKYKYALLVLIVGILLMNLPAHRDSKDLHPDKDFIPEPSEISFSEKLQDILGHIEGVGKVEVLLTIGRGPVTYYQENRDESESENNSSFRTDTVTITDAERNEKGLIRQIDPEIYRGATVICQGADKPSVKLSVIEAVSKVTGLSSDRICVLKMN